MSRIRAMLRAVSMVSLILFPTVAWAHAGGGAHGFTHGFVHPTTGLDHVLAMVAVGLFAAGLGGRALWAIPLTFVSLIALGGWLGGAAIALPFVEVGIAISVIVLGLAVALPRKWPVAAAMALAGIFAVFHGHAHGAEMPVEASGLAYGLGFILATALLHTAGIGFGLGIGRLGRAVSPRVMQAAGGGIAIAGFGIFSGLI